MKMCVSCGTSNVMEAVSCHHCGAGQFVDPHPRQPRDVLSHTSCGAEAQPEEGGDVLWVTLERFPTLLEADMAMAKLEAAGIKAFIPDQQLLQTMAWNLYAFGLVRVQVAPDDFASAKAVISSSQPEATEVRSVSPAEAISVAQLPLSGPMKGVAFLLPVFCIAGIVIFAVAKTGYTSSGCDRRAAEWSNWFLAGCCFWFMFISLVVFISPSR